MKAAAIAARAGSPRAPWSKATTADEDEREVDELADQSLLGGDRHRDRVRCGERLAVPGFSLRYWVTKAPEP